MSRGHYHWQHEPCWYAVGGTAGSQSSGDRKQSTLWTINARDDEGHGHGTQKPVECMRRPIENNSSPGQAVYEPLSGSGTTIIAAEMTGRSYLAIEIDPAYVDVAVLRWQAFTGAMATLEIGGKSFPDVATERRGKAASSGPPRSQTRSNAAPPGQGHGCDGIPESDIVRVTGVDPKTLSKHYRQELDLGETKANAQVAGFLFSAAKNGNVTAQIFWLKTRARWRETPMELRHSGSIASKTRVNCQTTNCWA